VENTEINPKDFTFSKKGREDFVSKFNDKEQKDI